MARYEHANGEVIEATGTRYQVLNALGEVVRGADISRWADDAEKWIDNDLKDGYYAGFVKVATTA